jgi:competence protein ComEA
MCLSSVQALEVNEASEAELDGLRGIGPPFTRRLLDARQQESFQNWQDLMSRVTGMGPKVARSLSQQGLMVQGRSYEPEHHTLPSKHIRHPKP